MKKISILLLSFILLIVLSSCDLFKPKIERTIEKLNEAKSFTVRMVSLDPKYKDEEVIVKADNNKFYFLAEGVEIYTEIDDNSVTVYENFVGKWYKTKLPHLEIEYKKYTLFDFSEFNFDWFEKDGDKYILKEEYLEEAINLEADKLEKALESFESITLEIDDDTLIITFNVKNEYGIQMFIFDIGDTEIELPEAEDRL